MKGLKYVFVMMSLGLGFMASADENVSVPVAELSCLQKILGTERRLIVSPSDFRATITKDAEKFFQDTHHQALDLDRDRKSTVFLKMVFRKMMIRKGSILSAYLAVYDNGEGKPKSVAVFKRQEDHSSKLVLLVKDLEAFMRLGCEDLSL